MADNAGTARVLTLVFTDLADSTALKTERGDQEVGELILRHRDCASRLAAESRGRVIDWAGDGCFLTFETSSAAVTFALRLQQAHAEDSELPGVRIGLHMGEVTERPGPDGDENHPRVEGLAVDLAARIQSLAKPGQVLMSSAVYHSARQRLGVKSFGQPILWQTHGAYSLKGFDEPLDIGEAGLEGVSPLEPPEASEKAQPLVPVPMPKVEVIPPEVGVRTMLAGYGIATIMILTILALVARGISTYLVNQSADSPSGLEGPITSLAVLPLDNLMNDPEQDYFADGMTEAITAELAKIKALRVISRTSAMGYKGSTLSMPEIAAELGVQGLVEGSVLRDGDEVRVTVQLIDGRTDSHVWSENYTDTIDSVLKLQAEVALAIAKEIRATVTQDEEQRIASANVVNREAYDAYLKAWQLISVTTEESLTRALEYLKRAQEIDPNMAEAWAAESRAHWVLTISQNWSTPEQIEKVRVAASRALALDETQFYGHIGMGSYAHIHDKDWDTAQRHFQRAIDLNPSEPLSRFYLGNLNVLLGDWSSGLEQAEELIRLSPAAAYERSLASVIFYGANEPGRALEILQEFNVADMPRLPWQMAQNYLRAGDVEQALQQSRAIDHLGLEAVALAQGGRHEEALDVIRRIQNANGSTARTMARETDLATAYIWMGDLDNAFQYIERAYEELLPWITALLREAYLDGRLDDSRWIAFRNDPRYWSFVERMKLPPLPPEHPGYAEEQTWLARKAEVKAGQAPIEKIAVLPFDNMSSDPEQEFFVDGMTEALITELAKIKSLQVRGRTTIMRFKNTEKSIREIARELDVDGIVEGSVIREDDDVRITAQLIHAHSDTHRWAASFDSTVTSILKLHSDMALAIVKEIQANLSPEEETRLTEAHDVNPAAYEQFLRGNWSAFLQSESGYRQSQEFFARAIEIDPEYSAPYANLGIAVWASSIWGWSDPLESIGEAKSLIEKSLALDPNNPHALLAAGWIAFGYDYDWDRAREYFLRSVEMNPGDANPHHAVAWSNLVAGRYEEGIREGMTSLELDPLNPQARDALADAYSMSGQYEKAIEQRRRTLEISPDHVGSLQELTEDYLCAGEYTEALATYRRLLTVIGVDADAGLAVVLAFAGEEKEARMLLETETERSRVEFVSPLQMAVAYVALDETKLALDWLEQAYEHRTWKLIQLDGGLAPLFASIYDEPRFQALIDKMNFPEREDTN